MKGQEVPSHRRRKGKKVKSNIDLAAHNQSLKQQWQLNDLSILTLNVNGFNSPIKRHHLANWIKKGDPTIFCLQETYLIERNKHWLRVKGWKKIYQANGPRKQAGVAILISDEVDFKPTLGKGYATSVTPVELFSVTVFEIKSFPFFFFFFFFWTWGDLEPILLISECHIPQFIGMSH
jgi:hypothetical protein